MATFKMGAVTERVYDHIVNYEPTYLALQEAVALYQESSDGIAEARELLADAVEGGAFRAAGLDCSDLDGVDYSEMIQWEAGE